MSESESETSSTLIWSGDGEEWSGAMWKAKAEAEAKAWETLKDAVEAYMGPSPVTFFTVLAVAVALALDFYYAVSGFLEPQPQVPRDRGAGERETVEPLPLPVQLEEITEEELRAYDGSGPK
nr:PREDICTED: membrane steroid-binding protein 2-like [Musa acuminata subsp. malaccensis]